MSSTQVSWDRPGPGTWEFDASHQAAPYGRFSDELMLGPSERGTARGFRECGLPLETLSGAIINGWAYIQIKPLGGGGEGSSPPPAFVFWLLFNLHPELRRRRKSARRFMAERGWEAVFASWFESERAGYVARIQGLQDTPPSELSDAALGARLTEVATLAKDLTERHFTRVPSCAIPTGDYLVHTERWAGVSAGQAIRALAGFTEATTEPTAALDRIVQALREEGRLSLLQGADAADVVAQLAEGDTASAALYRDYAKQFGVRLATDYSILGPTLNELPHLIVGSLRSRAQAGPGANPARDHAERAAAELEQRIPSEHRAAWRVMLHAARTSGEVRDDDGGLCLALYGIARGLALEAGARLVAQGRAAEAESACDLTCEELVATLGGAGLSKAEIERHTAQRRAWAKLTPPTHLGPAPEPPPIDSFPKDVARIVAAMFAFASRFSADADPIPEQGALAGHGISPGVVRGRACLVVQPEDFARFQLGDVLVARATTPAFNTLLANASAVVTQTGGLICHAAIVAREFGMPGVVGVAAALDAIPDGSWIEVDGDRGVIQVLGASPPAAAEPSAAAALEPASLAEPAADSEPQVAALEHAADADLYGGKAANLCRLVRSGVFVPRGIALDYTAAHQALHGTLPEALSAQLEALSAPLAVRSTANVEDSSSASFAGQFTTKLGVGLGASLQGAIREVLESAVSPGVLAYRKRMQLTHEVRMAVLIQELVPAATSGVMFLEPAAERVVVEATYGLGEPLVSGEISPDRYELSLAGELLQFTPGEQATQLVSEGGELAQRPAPTKRAEGCLLAPQLAELAALGQRVADLFGGPQDIEWAFATDGQLYCLQARPITRTI